MRKSEKQGGNAKVNFEDDVDALFRLPLAEFTGARNALAALLKKSGRGDEAVVVKAWSKPSVSAWAVNQLYWNHREAFDRLIASGERFHKAQASRGGAKVADMRTALDARREALTHLSNLATSVLREAGHNPAPDTIHRITTTLEGISAYATRDDGPRLGRLTHDVDPPGFESFASFVPAATKQDAGGRRQAASGGGQPAGGRRQAAGITNSRNNKRQEEEARKAKIAAAKVSLHDAKRSLTAARARAQRLEAAQKKADADAKKAAENLKKAKAAAEDAARRARNIEDDVEEAATAVKDAERTVEKASEELETLVRELSGR